MLADTGKGSIIANGGKPPGEDPLSKKKSTIDMDIEFNKSLPPSKLSQYQQDFLSDDHKPISGIDHKNKSPSKARKDKGEMNLYGSDPDEEDEIELLCKQMEVDILRLTQRVNQLETSFPS